MLKWVKRIICCLCGVFVLTTNTEAQVVINEVMFDPDGSEFFDEYIEIYNVGDVAVDLKGWRVGDDDQTNAIVGEITVLAPKHYALILDSGYARHSSHYQPLPQDVLQLTVDSPTLGHSGLSNVRSERILLVNVAGDTVAIAAYEPGNIPGVSEEKIDAGKGDGRDNWADAKWVGGTPGAVNSVSAKDKDLALHLKSESPVYLPWGELAEILVWIHNVGRNDAQAFEVTVNGDQAFAGAGLSAGDSTLVPLVISEQISGRYAFEAVVTLAGDQDFTNDGVTWDVIGGVAPGRVVISEVMAQPSGGSEWVELYNRSPDAVQLVGWSLSDLRTTGKIEQRIDIEGFGYIVVAGSFSDFRSQFPDVNVPVVSLSQWPRLNDGGDGIVLRDGTQTVVDSVYYPAGEDFVSLERVDLDVPGDVDENWLISQDPLNATPGAINSVRFDEELAGITLSAEPNPFVEHVEITYQLPTPRASANLWVFDRSGRRVASLLENIEGGSQRIIRWDGRSDQGQILKPGIYVLYLEAGTSDGELFRVRKPVVFAKGLE